MRFGPWYPLADARDLAPATEGVLQLRLARGLLDYPRGKSAMVHYAHAEDVRAAAVAWAAAHGSDGIVCRHLIEGDDRGPAALCARLMDEFVRRFGAAPRVPEDFGGTRDREDPHREGPHREGQR
jgi:hypothetical protein